MGEIIAHDRTSSRATTQEACRRLGGALRFQAGIRG
jgi:hypothetical protein